MPVCTICAHQIIQFAQNSHTNCIEACNSCSTRMQHDPVEQSRLLCLPTIAFITPWWCASLVTTRAIWKSDMNNIYPKTNQSQHDSAHNTASPHVGPQTTHTATSSNFQKIKTIFQALGFGISSFILLTMFAIFISNPVEAATEIPQVSINLDEVDSGQLLLRSENVISSAILLTTDVKITVSGTVSRTTVSQRFINTGATWAEGVYAFPVGETAAVDSLKMRIGDSFIEGQIKEKKAAKIAYETAKREGKKLFRRWYLNVWKTNTLKRKT